MTVTFSKVGFIMGAMFWCLTAFSAHRLQICAMGCKGPICKRLAQDVEFELELSDKFLIPPCKKGPLSSKEFRLQFSKGKSDDQIEIELQCQSTKTCLKTSYAVDMKRPALTTLIVNEVKTAIKHNKPFEKKEAPKVAVAHTPPAHPREEEWDHVVVSLPKEEKAPKAEVMQTQEVAPIVPRPVAKNKMMSLCVGAENWTYTFDADHNHERMGAVRSGIYPGLAIELGYWPWEFLQLSATGGFSFASLRLKANQPVEGDGTIANAHMYYGTFMVGAFQNLLDLVDVGVEAGYDFQGAFVDSQRVLEKAVTVVPGFQSHGLRLGPRIVIGRQSGKAMLDIRAGLNPYTFYVESPDEPTNSKRLFRWSVRGAGRLILTSDMYLDAVASANFMHIHYIDDAIRENADGEKWGAGRVLNASSSFMAGLGWMF